MSLYAFRCKKCGHLVHSDHAGERDYPTKCAVCGAGIVPAMSLTALQKDRPELFVDLTADDLKDIKAGGLIGPLPFGMIYFCDHSNWQVLADLKPEELTAIDHALKPEHVHKHTPFRTEWRDSTHKKVPHIRNAEGQSVAHARGIEDGGVAKDSAEKT